MLELKFHFYQIIVLVISSIMIFQGVKDFIRGKSGQSFYKVIIRIVVWGGMSLIAIFPQATNLLAQLVGLEGNINAVILSGFLLIFLMIFKLLSAIERLEQNISALTREEALEDIKRNTKNKE